MSTGRAGGNSIIASSRQQEVATLQQPGHLSFKPRLWFNGWNIKSQEVTGGAGEKSVAYLSLEMLQSMTVFLLVLTMMKGRWMMELGGGALFACCSVCLFRCTRFLKAICCGRRRRAVKRGRGEGALGPRRPSVPAG